MTEYKVVEKFVSINGEGPLAGQLAVFIRFHGCNLECAYCDTAWANDKDTPYTLMTAHEIYQYIQATEIINVTLTGGEPLLQRSIYDLLVLLTADPKLRVEIETNGSIDLSSFVKMSNPPAFTMDYKLPGSKMNSKMLISNFNQLTQKDTVKFVIGSIEDFHAAKAAIDQHDLTKKCNVHLSAVFGKISGRTIVELMKSNIMNDMTFQLQMHKIVWNPDEKGV